LPEYKVYCLIFEFLHNYLNDMLVYKKVFDLITKTWVTLPFETDPSMVETNKPGKEKLKAIGHYKGMKGNNEIKTLSHSSYRCQYHIVFAPKYRRQIIYGKIKKDVGEILRKLCEQKGVEIIEAEACKDHIHLLVSIPLYLSVAQFMGYLKGKCSLMVFDRHANLKYKYGTRSFWCRGYYVDTVG
jgi:putative transposase